MIRAFWLPSRPGRRWLFLSAYLGFCYVLGWFAIQAFWLLSARVPFNRRPTLRDQFFPSIRISGLSDHHPRRTDQTFDLLLLGGSAIHPDWGTVERELGARLEEAVPGRWRVYNLSQPGYTSRDSLLTYRQLETDQFDLVVVYDGINDVRLNCCPPELFADDYSHAPRYAALRGRLDRPAESVWKIASRGLEAELHWGATNPDLLDHARNSQTPRTLRQNLAELARLAGSRGDPLVLLTYAWHLPADYTSERFAAGTLDYARQARARCPAELWARPADVDRILRLQNEAIREIAAHSSGVTCIDMANFLPRDGETFVDPCHLTDAGCVSFVDRLWPTVAQAAQNKNERRAD